MTLYKEDLKNIGYTAYEGENDKLVICSYGKCIGIERIMLRNILLLFGDYKIVDEGDVLYTDGTCDWEFTTDFPWSEYCNL